MEKEGIFKVIFIKSHRYMNAKICQTQPKRIFQINYTYEYMFQNPNLIHQIICTLKEKHMEKEINIE